MDSTYIGILRSIAVNHSKSSKDLSLVEYQFVMLKAASIGAAKILLTEFGTTSEVKYSNENAEDVNWIIDDVIDLIPINDMINADTVTELYSHLTWE